LKIVFAIVNVWSIFINNEKELLFTRIFYKGRREKSESAGDSAFDAGNCLQAYWQYVENNFQDKR